jgi:hypothetical protein
MIINFELMRHNDDLSKQMSDEMTQRGASIKFGFAFENDQTAHLWHSNDVNVDTILTHMEQMTNALREAQRKMKKN